jgi:hypothetical protein
MRPVDATPMPNLVRTIPVLATLLLVSLAPVGQAQVQNPNVSTPTTLYFHIFDTFNPFPINTQPMNVSFFEVGGNSFPTASGTPVHTIAGDQVGDYDFNTIYGFATSGPVEYDFIENGRPRFHPERGIAADVPLDTSVTPYVYLYVDVRDFLSCDVDHADFCGDTGGLPQVLPAFVFDFEMRTRNVLGEDADLDAGDLIMDGQLKAHLADTHAAGQNAVLPADIGGTPVLKPDESGVIEVKIPLTFGPTTTIPKRDAYHVKLSWYQDPSDGQSEDQFAQGYVRFVSSIEHLPRLELAIMNPVYIDFIHPQVAAGILLIHSGVNSPWGTYDVDVANIGVEVRDEAGNVVDAKLQPFISQNQHVHNLHDKPAEVTYLWRFRDDGAKDGDYTIHISVPNLAGNAVATGQAGFTLEGKKAYGISESGEIVEPVDTEGKDKGSPGLPLVGALLALAAVALLRRRSA